jgi:hypothetical protein
MMVRVDDRQVRLDGLLDRLCFFLGFLHRHVSCSHARHGL